MVIAIVSVLVAILLVGLGKIRQTAQSSQCTANLRQLHLAATMWGTDNGHRMPDARYWGYNNKINSSAYPYQLAPYLGYEVMEAGNHMGVGESVMACPAASDLQPSTREWGRTYSINNHATSTSDGARRSEQWYPPTAHSIPNPARMALFMDGAHVQGAGGYWTNVQNTYVDPSGGGATLSYPHANSVNVVFVDGHVESIAQSKMIELYSEAQIPFWRYTALN